MQNLQCKEKRAIISITVEFLNEISAPFTKSEHIKRNKIVLKYQRNLGNAFETEANWQLQRWEKAGTPTKALRTLTSLNGFNIK